MLRVINQKPERPILIFLLIVLLYGFAGALLIIWPKRNPIPLVNSDGWSFTGQLFTGPVGASALDVPEAILNSPDTRFWRTWSPATGATSGHLVSAPFDVHPYLAIPFFGFPGEIEGNTITLRCVADNAILPVADVRTNTQWATAYLHVPGDFCQGQVRLEAQSNGSYFVGVGTPYMISMSDYYKAKAFPTRSLCLTLTWAWLTLLMATAAVVWKQLCRQGDALTIGFAALGVLAMASFCIFHFSATGGVIFTSLIGVLVPVSAAATYILRREDVRDYCGAHGLKFLIWLLIAWTYVALISTIDNGGGSWSVNGAFSPVRWSSDNQLPVLFSEAMYGETPRNQITWGPWLASDRPPLLTGLLLLARAPLIGPLASQVSTEFVSTLYTVVGIVLLSSWVLPVYRFGECGHRDGGLYLVAAAAMTPFFLFNSVYIWPKLLGASYALLVLLDLYALPAGHRDRIALILASVSAALSTLCHASNAVVFPVMGLLFRAKIWRQGIASIGLAVLAGAVTMLPWQLWQTYVQPHGNALLRYALTGDFGMANRKKPILPEVISYYQRIGLAGLLWLKLEGLWIMLGLKWPPLSIFGETASFGPGVTAFGKLRLGDFFSVVRAIGTPLVGVLLLPVASFFGQKSLLARDAILCGLFSILLTSLAFVMPPITHSLPYAGVALMLVGGASVLLTSRGVAGVALAAEAFYCLEVWIMHPISFALRIDSLSLIGLGAGLAVLLCLFGPWCCKQDKLQPGQFTP